jgi:hypothetical protein
MSTPRELTYKAQEKANYRAVKKARWARKTLIEKFAHVWLYSLFTALLTALCGFLLVMTAIAEWEMPWYADLWFNGAMLVMAITWFALSVE